MMTENELDALYDELGKPYTKRELDLHCQNRSLKSELEIEHAYNHEALSLVEAWIRYATCADAPEPTDALWRIVRPGNGLANMRCRRIRLIVDLFKQHAFGQCPRLPILVYCSRSAMTFFDRMAVLRDSNHLERAREALLEILSLVSNGDRRRLSQTQYENRLDACCLIFIAEMSAYSYELGDYLRDIRSGRANPTPKPVSREELGLIVRADGEKTRRKVSASESHVKREIRMATQGCDAGCHHPNKAKDVHVQKVVQHLARPGVIFSLHNACAVVGGKNERGTCRLKWLYSWCHDHAEQIRTATDIMRSLNR